MVRSELARLAIVAITRGGVRVGTELAMVLGSASDLYVPRRFAKEAAIACQPYDRPLREIVPALFNGYDALVMLMSVGSCVRLIAPLLSRKDRDPAVVAVDEAGRFATVVVGGHSAQGNRLATRIADALSAEPVVTTASEAVGLPAVDLLGEQFGWALEADPEDARRVSAAAINGEAVGLYQDAGPTDWQVDAPDHWPRLPSVEALASWPGPAIAVTDQALDSPWRKAGAPRVVFRPPSLAVGIGCGTGTAPDEVLALIYDALADAGLAASSVDCLATLDRRAGHPAVAGAARALGVPLKLYSAEQLAAVDSAPTPSTAVARHVGTPGVCEPAAILASGGGRLLVPKRKSSNATVAIARLAPKQPEAGRLTVVGLGPGALDLIPPRARRALREADAVIGYRGYLDRISAIVPARKRMAFELGQEIERVRLALKLARSGRNVALVSSGDAGIYGMAGPTLEVLLDESRQRAPRAGTPAPPAGTPAPPAGTPAPPAAPDVEIVPGITAASAAAALLGAPLALDFAAVSLSDALVPWDEIAARLSAVAAADLALVLYNPASARRRRRFEQAVEIILAHRPPSTPVGVVQAASRAEQSVRIVDLGDLASEDVGMHTIIVVGSERTERLFDRLVTRRGYGFD